MKILSHLVIQDSCDREIVIEKSYVDTRLLFYDSMLKNFETIKKVENFMNVFEAIIPKVGFVCGQFVIIQSRFGLKDRKCAFNNHVNLNFASNTYAKCSLHNHWARFRKMALWWLLNLESGQPRKGSKYELV